MISYSSFGSIHVYTFHEDGFFCLSWLCSSKLRPVKIRPLRHYWHPDMVELERNVAEGWALCQTLEKYARSLKILKFYAGFVFGICGSGVLGHLACYKGHAGSWLRSCDLKDWKYVETVVTIKSTLSSHKRHSCQKKTVLPNGKEQTRHSLQMSKWLKPSTII